MCVLVKVTCASVADGAGNTAAADTVGDVLSTLVECVSRVGGGVGRWHQRGQAKARVECL